MLSHTKAFSLHFFSDPELSHTNAFSLQFVILAWSQGCFAQMRFPCILYFLVSTQCCFTQKRFPCTLDFWPGPRAVTHKSALVELCTFGWIQGCPSQKRVPWAVPHKIVFLYTLYVLPGPRAVPHKIVFLMLCAFDLDPGLSNTKAFF